MANALNSYGTLGANPDWMNIGSLGFKNVTDPRRALGGRRATYQNGGITAEVASTERDADGNRISMAESDPFGLSGNFMVNGQHVTRTGGAADQSMYNQFGGSQFDPILGYYANDNVMNSLAGSNQSTLDTIGDNAWMLGPALFGYGALSGVGAGAAGGELAGGAGSEILAGGAGADTLGAGAYDLGGTLTGSGLGGAGGAGGFGLNAGAAGGAGEFGLGTAGAGAEFGLGGGATGYGLSGTAAIPAATGAGGAGIVSSINNALGTNLTGAELARIGLGAGQAIGGYFGAGQQADAYRDVANQQSAIGAPFRNKLAESYGKNFNLWDQPGYQGAFERAGDIATRQVGASVGNPYGNPGAMGAIQNQLMAQNYLPALANYRGQLGQFGGMGLNTSADASLAAAGMTGQGLNALGYGAATAFGGGNPMDEYVRILTERMKNENQKNALTVGGSRV